MRELDTSTLIEAGHFNKPHGIKGEISATLTIDGIDLADVEALFVEMDGITVPFFIDGLRPRSADTWLLKIDGIDTEEKARGFAGKTFSLLPGDVPDADAFDPDADGFYASDLIGFAMTDSEAGDLGTVEDVNDTTANVLFVVRRPDGQELLVPVADEFIDSIDPDSRIIYTTLPESLVHLNSKK